MCSLPVVAPCSCSTQQGHSFFLSLILINSSGKEKQTDGRPCLVGTRRHNVFSGSVGMKQLRMLPLLLLAVMVCACGGPSQEDLYGWWKLRNGAGGKQACICVAQDVLLEGKMALRVLSWERKPDSDIFRAKTDLLTFELRLDDDDRLHFIFPNGMELVYTRITEDEARRLGFAGN